MNRKKAIIAMLALLPMVVRAYDFSAVLPTGQTLYFDYVAGGVEVVRPNTSSSTAESWTGFVQPTGALTIPSVVSDGTSTLAVVGVANYAFHSCSGLTSVTLAEGIASVGTGAFYQCTSIGAVSLPSSVASVGAAAFAFVAGLSDVWCWASIPPAAVATAFYNVDLALCTLHIPCGTRSAYEATTLWGSFGTMDELFCSADIAVGVNHPERGSVVGAGTYAMGSQATLQAVAAEGYRFVCWNDGVEQNPRVVDVVADSLFEAWFFAVPVDTMWISDTVYYAVIEHDTVYTPVLVHDTLVPTFFSVTVGSDHPALGIGVGSSLLPAGTEVEVCGLPIDGARFVGWSDGSTANPRRLVVTGNVALTACFERLSAAQATEDWSLTVMGRRVTVACVAGERLRLYDLQGRCHLSVPTSTGTTSVEVPGPGVWLVRVGEGPARKIVIDN